MMEQGELNVKVNANGTVTIGTGHTISGDSVENLLKSASDAYGKRLGKVTYADGTTEVLNEYKENPVKEVPPEMLREVPMMHVEFQRNEDGSIAKDANGKNIVESFGVKYADGTISYTGAGREGVLEAERRRSSAKLYNEAITDARTREDFDTDDQYNSFVINKNIRIGQGSYVKLQDKQGNSKLVAPNGAVVAEGTEEEIRDAYRNESNKLNMAMYAVERAQTSFSSNEKQYIMQTKGFQNDAQFNSFIKSELQKTQQTLQNIYSSWGTAAQEQGIDVTGKNWYQPILPDLTTFVPTITQSTLGYNDWYSINVEGKPAEITTGTDTTLVTEPAKDDIEATEQPADTGTDTTTPQVTLPNSTPYTLPAGYSPTPFGQQPSGTSGGFAPLTGTFTKPTTQFAGYSPTEMPTTQLPTIQTPSISQPQQYEVRNFRNASGMTTSITFVNGVPQTPIPSGFYPVSAQPQGLQTPQTPQVNPPSVTPVTGYRPRMNNPVFAYQQPTPMASGGIVPPVPTASGDKFGGFKPEAMQRIAQNLGYSGDMGGFDQYLNDNPDKKEKMDNYTTRARQMAQGGMVKKYAPGGFETGLASDPNFLSYYQQQMPQQRQNDPATFEERLKAQGYNMDAFGNVSFGGPATQQETPTQQLDAYGQFTQAQQAAQQNLFPTSSNITDPMTGYTLMPSAGIVQNNTQTNTTASTMPEQQVIDLTQYDPRTLGQQYIPQQASYSVDAEGNTVRTDVMEGKDILETQEQLALSPTLPEGATVVPTGTQLTSGQLVSPYSGQVGQATNVPTTLATTEQAMMPLTGQASLMSPVEATGAVSGTLDQASAAQLTQAPMIDAAQQTTSAVSDLKAAQGTGIEMTNPVQREIQEGELISGAANAQKAAEFNEQIEAATAEPSTKATVAGQLEGLMAQFEGGETPAWAAGSMRKAMAEMAARGLGASSMAGQAVIQAAMESALPIAQMDAQTQAQFESQNLSNRQQRAILAAQQRAQFLGQEFDQEFQSRVANAAKISDVANMNFTAEQQIALENSRIANTMELNNLSNRQAMVIAEASALANMDLSNLNNRQQAAVQNAQNFLQTDLSNLSNQQQMEMFKVQQRVQSLFTDQAALNAAQQFNATSQNQVDQFFTSLQSQVAQFNASQANAQGQFNAGQANTIERFNAEINNQRDQFNAQNTLIIDQSNAQWRREIATADTAAVNRSNEINAQALLGLSATAYNNLWQYYGDNMEWAWTSAENERKRVNDLAMVQLQADAQFDAMKYKSDAESSSGFGGLIGKLLTAPLTGTLGGTILGSALGDVITPVVEEAVD